MPIISRLTSLCNSNPFILYAVAWTSVVTLTVAVAAFAPEIAFVWAVSPSAPLTRACWDHTVGLPMDGPVWEKVCFPAKNFSQSKVDIFIPPVFAVLVVVGSVSVMKAIGLWEGEEEEEEDYNL
ncbi:hypothetical protein LUZ63_007430 [Rhynchospora breviuscula]|uniref:Uncharacterized protein n=1 Tax=Rhynchospora breviuscula TaxID=2022672 RepID=A0A9Q0CRN5_9POAL|nr:hypothetical protein LUZ63_007430 [Rhynchospora breviuscula]